MRKLFRIILGAIIAILGFGATGVGVFLIFSSADLPILISIGFVIVGLMIGAGGVAIATGARIREIIDIFLLGS